MATLVNIEGHGENGVNIEGHGENGVNIEGHGENGVNIEVVKSFRCNIHKE